MVTDAQKISYGDARVRGMHERERERERERE